MASQTLPPPGSAEYNKQMANWDQDPRTGNTVGLIISIVAATITLCTRLYQTRRLTGRWNASDYLITLAWLIAVYIVVATIVAYTFGYGLHQVRVIQSYPNLDAIKGFQSVYLVGAMSAPCLLCIKLALLYYYAKLFYVHQKVLKWWLIGNAVYAILWGIGAFFNWLLVCVPVSCSWTQYAVIYGRPAPDNCKCVSIQPDPSIANNSVIVGSLGLVSDIAILVTPIFLLKDLQMSKLRKVALMFLFLLGFLAVGVSITRIVFFAEETNAFDITFYSQPSALWLGIEISVAIFCACVPPSAGLYQDILGRFFPSFARTKPSNKYYEDVGRQKNVPRDEFSSTARQSRFVDGERPPSQTDSERNLWMPKDSILQRTVIETYPERFELKDTKVPTQKIGSTGTTPKANELEFGFGRSL